MNTFIFNGDWTYEFELQQLAALKSDRFYKYRTGQQEKLSLGLVPVQIYDEETVDPDPRKEQINCIHWIILNQSKILEAVFTALRDTVFPYYINLWQDDPNDEYQYPKLQHIDNLKDAVGMDFIGIHFDFKDEISYYTLYFSFCVDQEHGLAMTFHKDRLIDFGGIGDIDNRKVIEDLGLNYDVWLEKRLSETEKKVPQLHVPDAKYGKLKPWQESANNYYPFGLLHSDRDDDLIQYLNANPIALKKNLERLISVAEYKKKSALATALRKL